MASSSTAPEPAPDGGARRPTILSPYGEGYCRWCLFVVGLGPDGKLDWHQRGNADPYNAPAECKGSGTRPPKVTPYASEKARFVTKSPVAWCESCKQYVPVARKSGGMVYTRHLEANRIKVCKSIGESVPAHFER